SARCGVMTRIPQASRIGGLSLGEQYAAIELFRGTMARHSLIVHRNDAAGIEPISFDGTAWLRYVPIRMPETICIQERLPAGAAAVLINQTHTYTDIFLPITAAEKRVFDAIDGGRTVSDILKKASPSSLNDPEQEGARDFFEKLWWHDQIVFDASQAADARSVL
ncbi:MAG: class I SAM-dependent methyltransferase, partial [Terracidiphilus sp.]